MTRKVTDGKQDINYDDFWYTYECGDDYEEQFFDLADAKNYCRKNGIDKIYKVIHYADVSGEYSGYNDVADIIRVNESKTNRNKSVREAFDDKKSVQKYARTKDAMNLKVTQVSVDIVTSDNSNVYKIEKLLRENNYPVLGFSVEGDADDFGYTDKQIVDSYFYYNY